jgi:hypothetical protein
MTENEISEKIIRCAIKVYNPLEPAYLKVPTKDVYTMNNRKQV